MSKEIEMREALKPLPEIIVMDIIYGFLNNNILGLLMNKQIDILKNAVIMENSSRRIDNRNAIMSMSRIELIHFILEKTGGLKNIRGYIQKAELNLSQIQDLQLNHLFSLNNGFTHKYYIITEVSQDNITCLEIKQYNSPFKYPHDLLRVRFISKEIKTVFKTQLKTAIILDVCRSLNFEIEEY